MWKLKPGQPPRQPGSLADLQEARATTIILIKRNDNHGDILGEKPAKSSGRSGPRRFVANWLRHSSYLDTVASHRSRKVSR